PRVDLDLIKFFIWETRVRLLTYAMLLKYGFNVGDYGRLINPTAIFCCDRDKYYEMLTKADSGTEKGMYEWCLYVLKGLLYERKKLDILLRYNSVKEKILLPSLEAALKASQISFEEYETLKLATNEGEIEAKDIIRKFNIKANRASYFIKNMREKKLIFPREEGKRSYILNLSAQPLMMGIIKSLEKVDLIPRSITKN
ncbi:MAG: Fic family protein, partial [Succinivibrio sp.]